MSDIAILVEGKYVNPGKTDWYIDQVLLEDQLLIDSLSKLGYSAEKVDWTTENKDWSKYKAVIFSAIWDYFHKFDQFCEFLAKAKGQTLFINSIEQIEWNMDKHYMNDLKEMGIPTVESYFIEKGDSRTLEKIHQQLNLSKTVIKPCVSGGGRHTYLLDPTNYHDNERIFREVIANESMILQPFQEQIMSKGEVSHMVFGGRYSHSILKKAKEGDYRVQDDFGGSVHEYTASKEEIVFAEKVAKACSPLPTYARVDVVWDNDDQLVIGEVELIEPEIWLRNYPEAADKLAKEVVKKL